MEKTLIFFPEKEIVETPADAGVDFEDLYITTGDGVRINGWFLPSPGTRTAVLWLHGNAGNMSNRVDPLRRLHEALKAHLLMIDYREYGRSEGTVSEQGTYNDAVAAYDYLAARPDIDPARIVVFGQSLGSAVAVELALQRRPCGLILEAPFTSVRAMAGTVFPWLPIGAMLSTKYDTRSKIAGINTPLLILHGDRDEIVPFSQGREVFEAAPEPKTFHTVKGAGHNDPYSVGGSGYYKVIENFITGVGGNEERIEKQGIE